MKPTSVAIGLIVGVTLGVFATAYCIGQTVNRNVRLEHLHSNDQIQAGGNDRYEDYIMCTGSASTNPRVPTDAVWMLDYRAGKLLGTIIDKTSGKIVGWAETNLTQEFNIPPKQNVHFMMTTGATGINQSALYVAETTTGKFAVYTLGGDPTGQQPGLTIRRHDMGVFRR